MNYKEQLIADIRKDLVNAHKDVDRNPTEGQKHAGNYAMGHVRIHGYGITIENPKGSYRRGTDSNGNKWSVKMNNDYGYFKSTMGYDGDAIDVFLGDDFKTDTIFVIDQIINGKFDESKVMFGFKTEKEAMDAYLSNYEKGWSAGKHITAVTDDIFREWLYDGYKQKKPFYQYKKIKREKLNEANNLASKALISEGRKRMYANMNVTLRKGGRNAVKMSIEDFKKQLDKVWKKFAMDSDMSASYGNWKRSSILELASPRNKNKKIPYLKDLYKDIWEDAYEFDCENFDSRGDVKMSSKGVPYQECYACGDWEAPVCIFVYFDGERFRAYIPMKGNSLCPATKKAYGNDCDDDDSEEIKQLMKEYGVKNREDLSIDPRDIDYNFNACLEDFMSRLTIKGTFKPTDDPKLEEKFKEFAKRKDKERDQKRLERQRTEEESQVAQLDESKGRKRTVRNDKGEIVPDKCPVCGSEIGLYIQGEPVYLCSNKKCGKYFGTMPFPKHLERDMKKKLKEKPIKEMKFKISEIASVIKEVIDEVGMDTLQNITQDTFGISATRNDLRTSLSRIDDFLIFYSKKGSKDAEKCLGYLYEIERFIERKGDQADAFETEYNNRYVDARDRLDNASREKYGKNVNDLDDDEIEQFRQSITDDDELHSLER